VNALDRAIAFVAPGWGMRRARARAAAEVFNTGYSQHGASHTKKSMAGMARLRRRAGSRHRRKPPLLRERSRDLQMGEGIAAGALKTIRTNEVGPGLQLNATIHAERLGLTPEQAQKWEDNVETEFALWAGTKSCDAARRCNFGQLQALAAWCSSPAATCSRCCRRSRARASGTTCASSSSKATRSATRKIASS
jgi:capsid protein